jgi:uncharacterized membrane protein YphA (DoxX/SURF4 family)
VTDTARLSSRVLHPRLDRGVPAVLLALVRAATGVFFVSVSTGKFLDHAQEAVDFDRYGVPAPEVAVYAVGVVELAGGLLLVVGLLTRPAALALALTLIGAIATAGRVEGGSFHLGVAPTFLVISLLLTWLGSGRPGLDPLLERRLAPRSAV